MFEVRDHVRTAIRQTFDAMDEEGDSNAELQALFTQLKSLLDEIDSRITKAGTVWPIACAIDTLNKLLSTGRGPEVFTIGRRRFCLRSAWHDWLDRLARTGGVRVTTGQDAAPRPIHRNLRGRPRKSTLVVRSEPAAK